jgi:acetyltransferase
MSASLDRLFSPKSIAVVGASPNPGKIGNVLMQNLAAFPGAVYPVHPSARDVIGYRAYPNVTSIEGKVDLALLAVPQGVVTATLNECSQAGVGAAVVYSGGWAESGEPGKAAQEEISRLAQETGLRILGPNTSGFINPSAGIYATFVADLPKKISSGPLTVVAQSGGVNISLCFMAQNEGLGIRLGVGLGNACDVGLSEVLDWIATDIETKVVALAIEGVANGRGLVRSIEQIVERCPVVALTAGQTDVQRFAQSHTGALTGSYKVKRAALRQAGAVIVDDLGEMIDAVRALNAARLAPKEAVGVGVVTGQAGPGLLLTDALRSRGLDIPTLPSSTRERLATLLPPLTFQENPVDTGRPGPTFKEVLKTVREAENIDMLAVSLIHERDAVDPVDTLTDVGPCVLCKLGPLDSYASVRDELASKGIAVYPTPERTAAGAAALANDSHHQWISKQAEGDSGFGHGMVDYRPAHWDEATAKDLLDRLQIRTPKRSICCTHQDAHDAMNKLGIPVAVKILHPEIRHKTEVGGVHLNVRTHDELDSALRALDRQTGAHYLIEHMAAAGPELLIGARHDPSFGPIVVIGSGGLDTEVEADISLRLAPVGLAHAHAMFGELSSAARYRGFRGQPAINEDELAMVIQSLGTLICHRDDIAEIEINPLRVTADGLIALDAVVIGQ